MNSDDAPRLDSARTDPLPEDTDVDQVLAALYDRYGYDFRGYSRTHVRRRLTQRLRISQLDNFDQLHHRILNEPAFVEWLLQDLSINVTEMFRDPDFFRALREQVVPLLKTWSYIKIWHAGCSTGEEVYSTAIALLEEGLYDRVQIYATDFNQQVLNQAREGIFPAQAIQKYARNYQLSGARASFSDYYHAKYDSAIMDPALKKHIVWAAHNLVTDSDFAEVQLVLCRNVLIYFGSALQNRVHALFHRSLTNGGFLCLGRKESLNLTHHQQHYSIVDRQQKIFRKKYAYG